MVIPIYGFLESEHSHNGRPMRKCQLFDPLFWDVSPKDPYTLEKMYTVKNGFVHGQPCTEPKKGTKLTNTGVILAIKGQY